MKQKIKTKKDIPPKRVRKPKGVVWKIDDSDVVVRLKTIGEYLFSARVKLSEKAFNNTQLQVSRNGNNIFFLYPAYVRALWCCLWHLNFDHDNPDMILKGISFLSLRILSRVSETGETAWIIVPFPNIGCNNSYVAMKNFEEAQELARFLEECFNYKP